MYLSDLKLSQIFDSIDERTRRTIATQLTVDLKLLSVTLSSTSPDRSLRNRGRVAQLAVAEQYLRQRRQIGDVDSGASWIEGRIDMGWKPLQDDKTVLFAGYAGSLLVVLGGSVGNVLGYPTSGEQTGSYAATIREAVSGDSQPEQFWSDLEATAREVFVLPQPVRFLARVLSRLHPNGDSVQSAIVLATPLYVELAEESLADRPMPPPQPVIPGPAAPPRPAKRDSPPPLPVGERRSIGPYQVQCSLGEGAMGTVYLVKDKSGRDLALKVVRPEFVHDAGFLWRFVAEADSARRVRHPAVARVVDVAVNVEPPYLVTEFAQGPTLAQKVSRDGPMQLEEAVALGIATTAAIAAIHGAGIIHRDLTPSNVILTPHGPKLIDFGAASAAAPGADLSADRLRLGTPGYMSPEQVQREVLTPASDIFSWASTMVYATTGHQPFGQKSRLGVFWEIQEDEPDLTGVPVELQEIVSAALAKAPAARPSAENLSDSLRAIARLAPSRNWPVHSLKRLSSGAGIHRRRRIGILIAAALILVAGAVLIPVLSSRGTGREARNSTSHAAKTASGPVLAAPAVGSLLTSIPLSSGDTPTQTGFSPDGKSVAVSSYDTTLVPGKTWNAVTTSMVQLWNIGDRKFVAAWNDPDPGFFAVSSIAFAPSGRILAAGDDTGHIYLWDPTGSGRPAVLHVPLGNHVVSLAYAPNGRMLAGSADNAYIYLWNASTYAPLDSLRDPEGQRVVSIAYSPAGNILAAGDADGHIYLWDTTTHARLASLADPGSSSITNIAFASSGRFIAAGDGKGHIYLWNATTHDLVAHFTDPSSYQGASVAFAPGGQVLAAGDGNGSTYLWDVATGKITGTLTDPYSNGVTSVAFNPAGTILAAADLNGPTYLWNVRTMKPKPAPSAS